MAKKSTARKQSGTRLDDFIVDTWGGINTAIKSAKDLDPGVSPDEKNWLTGYDAIKKKGDHIELRRGQALLGNTRNMNPGFVNGLGVGVREDGTQIPFWTYANNLQYYDVVSGNNISISTLPASASSDWISIESYDSIAGNFVYISSPNSSLYKIPVANPGSLMDIAAGQDLGLAIQGNINFSDSRMNLWNKNGKTLTSKDTIDYFESGTDFATYSSLASKGITTTLALPGAGEGIGSGDGVTTSFSHTLADQEMGSITQPLIAGAIGAGATISSISSATQAIIDYVGTISAQPGQYILIEGVSGDMGTLLNNHISQVIDNDGSTLSINVDTTSAAAAGSGGNLYSTEYFTDNQNGILMSNLGGTGTINYATGQIVVNFVTPPTASIEIEAAYYYQVPYTGVEKFVPDDTDGAGTAYIWPQRDGGGNLNNVQPFQGQNYCLHSYKTWVETTDPGAATNSTNIPFRNNIGTPFYKGAFSTGDGIVFLDYSIPAHPKFQQLAIAPNTNTDTVEPFDLAEMLDLSQYGFAQPVVFFWNNYYVLCCQNIINGSAQSFNGTMFVMDVNSGFWDRLDYTVSMLAQYDGTLISGDSLSPNLFTLFSGFDDDGSLIDNYWTSGVYNLGFDGLKKTERFVIEGLMQPEQAVQIYISYDQGPFTLVQTITGKDGCVSQGDPQLVGSDTIGSTVVGAGTVFANPFLLDFELGSDPYNYIQVKFVATGIGYIEIDRFALRINNMKSMHIQPANSGIT